MEKLKKTEEDNMKLVFNQNIIFKQEQIKNLSMAYEGLQ